MSDAALFEARDCRITVAGVVAIDHLTLASEGDRFLFSGDTAALFAALTNVPLGLRAMHGGAERDPEADAPPLGEALVAAGTLLVEGRSVADASHVPFVGAAPLDPPLPPRWTLLEYVAWSARLGGASRGTARDLAQAALAKVGLERQPNRRLAVLTLPERRALGLAHAAVLGPPVVIAESPLAGLEGPAAAFVLHAIAAVTEGRRAILSVARLDPASAEGTLARGATRIAVLSGGELSFVGAPSDLFSNARQYTLLVGANGGALREELAIRGIDLRGGPMRFSAALPAGTTTRELLLAARAADAPLLELLPL